MDISFGTQTKFHMRVPSKQIVCLGLDEPSIVFGQKTWTYQVFELKNLVGFFLEKLFTEKLPAFHQGFLDNPLES